MHDENTPDPATAPLTEEQQRFLAWAIEFVVENTDPNGIQFEGHARKPTELLMIADQLGLPDRTLSDAGKRIASAARAGYENRDGLADILHTLAAAADEDPRFALPYVDATGAPCHAGGEDLRQIGRRLSLQVVGRPRVIDPPALSPDQVCMLTAALERAGDITGDPELDWELKETLPDAFAQTGPCEVEAIQKELGIARAPVPTQDHDAHADAGAGPRA